MKITNIFLSVNLSLPLIYTYNYKYIQFYFKCIIELLFTLFICTQSATGALL